MDFVNRTGFAGHLFRGVLDEETLLAVAVCRLSFLISAEGRLVRQDIQEPVRLKPVETPAGPLEEDDAPLKPAVDVVVLGEAIARRERPVKQMSVELRIGEHLRRVRVTGNRTWQAARGVDMPRAVARSREGKHDLTALVPSAPEPFSRMPLDWAHAFGGTAQTPEGGAPWSDNPEGVGYHLLLEHAVGAPLPNIEDPARPLAHWRDCLEPIGFAPLPRSSRVRLERGLDLRPQEQRFDLKPELFLCAPPGQVLERLEPGTEIEVTGMHPEGSLYFTVPELAARVEARIGQHRLELPCPLDTVEIYPNQRRVNLVARAAFRYRFVRGDERVTELRLAAPWGWA